MIPRVFKVDPETGNRLPVEVYRLRPIEPQPWPVLLLPIKLLAKPSDRGAGDIITRTIGPIGGEAFKTWYRRLFGKDCGCAQRAETLNARWPL